LIRVIKKEWDQALKKEKWGRWNVMKLLSEMIASVSPDSQSREALCHLECRLVKQL
jgi:hypothetical protein